MKVCCVEGCKGPGKEDPVFFEFPTSRLLRKRWLDAISSPTKVAQNAVICIGHFASGDYEVVRGKTRLRSKVVPSLLVGDKSKIDDDADTLRDSTKSPANERTTDEAITDNEPTTQNVVKHNEKVHNDNELTVNAHNYNEKENNESEGIGEDLNDKKDIAEDVNEDKNKEDNDNVHNEQDDDIPLSDIKDGEKDDKNTQAEEKSHIDKDSCIAENKKDNNDLQTKKNENDNGKVNNDNGNSKDIVHNDNGKVRTSRKTRCKITAMRVRDSRQRSDESKDSSTDSVSSRPPSLPEMENGKEDIEGILTNYYIENKKTERQVAAMTDVLLEEQEKREEERREVEKRGEKQREVEWPFEASEPVFIELSVGQGANATGPAENDCLMLLESVQCDVDPALLLAAREDMDEEIEKVDLADDDDDDLLLVEAKKEDPISLLTSSDEDDVIIQERKIDTVEVSSADTSEDDMPLVKLVKPSLKLPLLNNVQAKRSSNLLTKLLWGGTDFYCVHCRYTTISAHEYTKHMATHSKVLQLCQDCGFTTCSKAQMGRHRQKHKNDRRYKCKRCNYSAKHEMSLVYHMKTHSVTEVELAICDTFEPVSKMSKTGEKSEASEKSEMSKASEMKAKSSKYSCVHCVYSTKRRSDLKRHRKRLHRLDSDDDDDEYVP